MGFTVHLGPSDKEPKTTYLVNSESEQQVNIKVNEEDAYPSKESLLKNL
jgi:hypothetical protein